MPVIRNLLFPFALEAVVDRVAGLEVAGIDVAADAERVLLPQSPLRRGAQAMREKVPPIMPEHDVRNDLLEARVVLHLSAGLEDVALADDRLVAVEVVGDEPMPCAVRKD